MSWLQLSAVIDTESLQLGRKVGDYDIGEMDCTPIHRFSSVQQQCLIFAHHATRISQVQVTLEPYGVSNFDAGLAWEELLWVGHAWRSLWCRRWPSRWYRSWTTRSTSRAPQHPQSRVSSQAPALNQLHPFPAMFPRCPVEDPLPHICFLRQRRCATERAGGALTGGMLMALDIERVEWGPGS